MALATCAEVLLTSLQNVFSTSVGVSFAYPILSQIIDVKSEKALKECSRVLGGVERYHGKNGMIHLGREKTQCQFDFQRLSDLNLYLMMFSALIGVISFILLVFSSISSGVRISSNFSIVICLVLSSPFAMGIFQLLRWYDAYARLEGAVSYYRGDHKWRKVGRRN